MTFLLVSLFFIILYYSIAITLAYKNIKIMKVIKLIFKVIWTISLQNIFLWIAMAWKWAWSKTTVDERAAAVAKEIKERVEKAADEMEDVVDALAGKEINANGKSKKSKSKSKK